MVSTRGVKFKFSENEKVLCYEPDPTKAKVLYESKVLELVVSRDSRGRKVPEYLIHFFGWNSSWDRCVAEDFILPDTEENRNLQTKLAEDAALSLKGKRKRKLPPIIKETLTKKECEGAKESESPPVLQVTESSSESDSSEEEMEKTVEIEIPQVLKEQLEDDCYWITKKNKIIKIPCEPNVVSVLEAYVKHLAVNLLCASPPKNPKNRNDAITIPEDVEAKLDLCKEVMDGLRVYFDFTLPHLLLYRQEQKQYYTLGTLCKPLGGVKREPQKDEPENIQTETKPKVASPTLHDSPSHAEQLPSSKVASSVSTSCAQSTFLYTPARGRPSLRHAVNPKQSSSMEGATNGGSASPAPSPRLKGSARFQHKDGSGQSTSLREKKDKTPGSKRILRSNDKQRATNESNSSVPPESSKASKSVNENDSNSPRPETPPMPASPTRPSRTLTKSTSQGMSPSSVATSCSSSQSSNQQLSTITNNPLSQRINPPPPLNFSGVTNSFSSSASSTHSSLSSPRLDEPPCRIINTSGMLSEILSWNMLPPQLYEQIPAPPSLIYGAQHLLRLFVKLPELIYRMNMPRRKLIPLMDYLESFLQYLSERREEIFLPTAYIEADEVSPDGNGPTLT